MRRDEPATMMHLIRPILLLLAVVSLLVVAEQASGDGVRIYDVSGAGGTDILLSHVAELEGDYAKQFADVVVGRFSEGEEQKEVEASAIIKAMRDKGAKLGRLDFSGYGRCKVYLTADAQKRAKPSESEEPAANPDSNSGSEPITVHTPTTVRSLIKQAIVKGTGVDEDDLVITFDDSDAELLRSSAVAGRYQVESTAAPTLGSVAFKVYAYHGTKRVGSGQLVKAKVQQKVIAVIAGDTIRRDETINRRSVRMSEVLISDTRQAYLTDTKLVVGLVAKSTVKAGDLITAGSIKMPIAVRRRERVKVEMNTNGIKISFNATAQQEGSIGDTIEVERTGSRERITVKIVGRGKVVAGEIKDEEKNAKQDKNKSQDQPSKEGK